MRAAKNKQNKQKQPRNIFKLLLVILAGMILFIIVLFFAAFRMLQWAQEYGLIDVPAEAVTIEGLGDIELSSGGFEISTGGIEISTGGIEQGAADANDMSDDEYQPASAIESIQMEYFMEES